MSLRITPPTAHPSHASNLTTSTSTSAASAPGLPDRLSSLSLSTTTTSSNNLTPSLTAQPASAHPLEARLARWTAAQDALKLESLRRTFGIAEPVRRAMELKICDAGEWRPAALGGGSGVHGDVLRGREAEIGWEDVFRGDGLSAGGEGAGVGTGFHAEMEGRMRMNW